MPVADDTHTYAIVAAAIRYLDAHRAAQPSLAELSAHVGLSPAHLQRVFSAWAGVSPAQFLQYLTRESARHRLRSLPVLDAALAAGLSGSGRLHDLMLRWEGVTPGEYRSGGAGLQIVYGEAASPFGRCFLARTARGVCKLAFFDDDAAFTWHEAALRADWPAATRQRDDAQMAALAALVFPSSGGRREPLRLLLRGSAFQLKVWEALLAIPEGALCSYQNVADAIGAPRATRAVASAIARNDIGWLIPCHRVIRATGEFSHYRWGDTRKQAMIGREAARGGSRHDDGSPR